MIVQKLNQRVDQIKTRRSISNNNSKPLHVPIPLTVPCSHGLQEKLLKPTMTITESNDYDVISGTDDVDREIVMTQLDNHSKNKTSVMMK